jgi:hypothetical protein
MRVYRVTLYEGKYHQIRRMFSGTTLTAFSPLAGSLTRATLCFYVVGSRSLPTPGSSDWQWCAPIDCTNKHRTTPAGKPGGALSPRVLLCSSHFMNCDLLLLLLLLLLSSFIIITFNDR